MTVQEAINHYKYGITHDIFSEPVTTYAKMAVEALEKQIPQSPTLEGDGYCPEGNLVYDTWICPNCERDYEVDYHDYDYCPNCGQKIDRAIFY